MTETNLEKLITKIKETIDGSKISQDGLNNLYMPIGNGYSVEVSSDGTLDYSLSVHNNEKNLRIDSRDDNLKVCRSSIKCLYYEMKNAFEKYHRTPSIEAEKAAGEILKNLE